MSGEGTRDFWRLIACYFLPPLGVFLQVGLGVAFWINLLLTVVFAGIPGQLHAVWVIATTREDGRTADDGMMTFVALVLAFWIPPIGVAMKKGIGVPFVINLLLTVLLFWLPGIIHAAWVITQDES
jgi:uncharacterized membrane protein YqaE (UPF0057 family)